MTSVRAAPPVRRLQGSQTPTFHCAPFFESTAQGEDAVELARSAGLRLDGWQQFVLKAGLAESRPGVWSSFEVATIVSRQNGKGEIIIARELAGLFLLPEDLLIHSSHEFKTAAEGFLRIEQLIAANDDLGREVLRIRRSNGEEAVELRNGKRLRFMARTGGSGRGFTGECVILDEAQVLGDENMAAILPTLSTRPNAQVWYFATAGTPLSIQLGRVRERALAGGDPSLTFSEWSAEPGDDHDSLETWAKCNPAMNLPGHGIMESYIAKERRAMAPHIFARERLGVGEYPTDQASAWQVIPKDAWELCADSRSRIEDDVAFAVDVTPDRSSAAIAVAGYRSDELLHVEVIARERGTGWVVAELARLADRYDPVAVVVDPGSPAGSLIGDIEDAGVQVTQTTTRDATQACGRFYDAVMHKRLRHLGQQSLDAALGGAQQRRVVDAWCWDRKTLAVDLCPLVAATLAAWGLDAGGLGPDDIGVY